MRRRDLVTFLGATAIGWPLAAAAQQTAKTRRVGVLSNGAANDRVSSARIAVFRRAHQALGWTEGQNIRIDVRYGGIDPDRLRSSGAELIALAPDAILVHGNVEALSTLTHSIPIVFVVVPDPVRRGIVSNLARPGGNITGFAQNELSMGSKYLQLLREIAPHVSRVAVMITPSNAIGHSGIERVITASAKAANLATTERPVRSARDLAPVLAALSKTLGTGLIFSGNTFFTANRYDIIKLVQRYHLPAVYAVPEFPESGGLMSYGASIVEEYRQAASYIDRILRGAKPGDLPVQNPTKYYLAINLKAAKALGLTVPPSLLIQADEVII